MIPRRRYSSDDSGANDSADDESSVLNKKPSKPSIIIQPSDSESSAAPSLCTSIENLNISDSEGDNLLENPDVPSPKPVDTLTYQPPIETHTENPDPSNNVEAIECEPSIAGHVDPAEGPTTPREAPKGSYKKRKTVPVKKTVKSKKKKTEPEPKIIDWKANTKINFNADTTEKEDDLTRPEKIGSPIEYFTKFFFRRHY